nr:transcription factor CP2-like protein 1 isoform X1 [Macaca fascicularis]XP_045231947.1 transcription factor CP2-like protein 1 isoform X1 [Macaca fascicularis]
MGSPEGRSGIGSQRPLEKGMDRAESWQSPPLPGRELLPLPYLKQEELSNIPGAELSCPMFQYMLCAATSPAVKLQEKTLTYLNQGQSYEVQMLCNSKLCDATQCPQLLKFAPQKKSGEKGVPFRL